MLWFEKSIVFDTSITMKRLLFVVLLMTCSASWAEWQLCTGDATMLVYCDKSTIRKNGAISRMWDMTDYSSVQTNSSGGRYMSEKSLAAYNCRDETNALISLVQYSGSMGQGNTV